MAPHHSSSGRPHRRIFGVLVLLALVAVLLPVLLSVPQPAAAERLPRDTDLPTFGLGGSSELPPDAVLPFSINRPTRYESAVFIRSSSSVPVDIVMATNLPSGIVAEALIDLPLTLAPGEGKRIPFALTSEEGLSTGLFDAIVSFNVTYTGPLPPGITFLPGFSSFFRVQNIGGATAKVTVKSVNIDDGRPARGQLSLYFRPPSGGSTLIDTREGDTLVRDVPAGAYEARFRIDGLVEQSKEFRVEAGEERTVTIEIRGITFLLTLAQPIQREGATEAARLAMVIRNNLRRFVGPVTFDVEVRRNDELVENFRIAELPELPEGSTQQQSTYVPPDGFSRGLWTFRFSVSTPDYTVTAAEVPEFSVGFRFTLRSIRGWLILVGVLLGIVLVGAALRRAYLLGRRRRDDDEEEFDPKRTRP
jgi:hypothetical protein